jgi:hypothetical protein
MAAVQLVTAASATIVALYFAETGASLEAAALAPAFYSLGFLVGCFYVAGANSTETGSPLSARCRHSTVFL